MSPLLRWWLHRRWAHAAHTDALARIDVGIVVFGILYVLLLR